MASPVEAEKQMQLFDKADKSGKQMRQLPQILPPRVMDAHYSGVANYGVSHRAELSLTQAVAYDQECALRDETRQKTRLRTAALRQTACLEDLDLRHPRGLDKGLVKKLASGS